MTTIFDTNSHIKLSFGLWMLAM